MMSCGTLGAIGGVRPATSWELEIADPLSGRTLQHRYVMELLPVIA